MCFPETDLDEMTTREVFEARLEIAHNNAQDALNMLFGHPEPKIKRSFWVRRALMKAQNILIKEVIREKQRRP